MTVAEHRAATRLKPLGPEGLEKVRAIVAGSQAQKVNEVFVDAFTASAIVKVHDALNETNRSKLLAMPIGRVAEVVFKLIK